MSETELTFLGTGDPLGSGGRLQTCFHVAAPSGRFLIDCGATSMVAMKRRGIDRNAIEVILVTHLHGDHIGGIPYFVLDAQHVSKRTAPLTVAGPPGIEARIRDLMDATFPGLSDVEQRFELRFVELEERRATSIGPTRVTPFEVVHACGAPPYALRVEVGGRTITYSGDTEWTDALVEAARDADLFVCECYSYEKRIPNHLDYRTLRSHREELTCDRLLLTHMTEGMLSRLPDLKEEGAADGMRVTV